MFQNYTSRYIRELAMSPGYSGSHVFCLLLLLYVPCQQLWSLRDGQFT